MSRRTAESNKAILAAWNKEQELVQEGKGTRDWTPKQQQDILEKGKAYDDNGVAFQGQHMKSAEMYPEYQGDPGNIQFLTRAEHLEAHNGNWRNPTNWYFNPVTKMKLDFGKGPFIPCEVVCLSDAIMSPSVTLETKAEILLEAREKVEKKETSKNKSEVETKSIKSVAAANTNFQPTRRFGDGVEKILKVVFNFFERHSVLKRIVGSVVASVLIAIVQTKRKGRTSPSNRVSDVYSYEKPRSKSTSANINADEVKVDSIGNNDSEERLLPSEHTVREHGQHYIKNGERVWIEKDSYTRGGNKGE